MAEARTPEYRHILGMRTHVTSYKDAAERVVQWALQRRSAYVCVANVHMVMEAYDSPEFRSIVNSADLVTPDGQPLVWALRLSGAKYATQVRGADLLISVAEQASRQSVPIGLYGGTRASLDKFVGLLEQRYPEINVACAISPPFRPLTPEEDDRIVGEINESGARVLFVGIGCPKQEKWMAAHKGKILCATLGVGAAFDFHTGRIRQAPQWMQRGGLEWAFRLMMDPKRLWKRYAKHNPRFLGLLLLHLLRGGQAPRR